MELICGNGIAEIKGKFIAINPFHFFIFLLFIYLFKKWYVHTIFTIFLQQILSGKLLLLD